MKYAAWVVWSAVLAGCLAIGVFLVLGGGGDLVPLPQAVAAASPAAKPPAKAAALPALKVDRNAPLLLDEPPPRKPSKSKGPVADNHSCFVCHTNYQDESMAVAHADANVGCIKCHGESIAHRNDENNITPPGTMYPPEKIEASCLTCHETHDAPAKKVLARWKERCPTKTDFAEILCTDCHGEHRLKLRTVRWDKRTGQLLTGAKPQPKPAAGPPPRAK